MTTTIIPPPPTQPLSSDRALYDWLYIVYAAINGIEPGTETIGQSADPSSGILALGLAGAAIKDAQSYALMASRVREKPAESIPPVIALIDAAKLAQDAAMLSPARIPIPKQMSIRVLSASASIAIGEFADVDATSGAVTITLPPASTNSGKMIGVAKSDASGNYVTLSGQVNGAATTDLTTQYTALLLISNGTEWRAW